MFVLTIDTATPVVTAGVVEVTEKSISVLSERSVTNARGHAEFLTTLILESLTEAQIARAELAAVVAGVGPGPFTGLRVGMATAAAFADALQIPAYGVSSLDAIAAQAFTDIPEATSVVVVTDARRREVYWARYEKAHSFVAEYSVVTPPAVQSPTAVSELLSGTEVFFAAGSVEHIKLIESLSEIKSIQLTPSAFGLSTAALPLLEGTDFSSQTAPPLVPLYLRRPDAVELKDQRAQQIIAVGANAGEFFNEG